MDANEARSIPDSPLTSGEAKARGLSRTVLRGRDVVGVSQNLFRRELADGFDSAVQRIRQALRHAWIDPSAASGFA